MPEDIVAGMVKAGVKVKDDLLNSVVSATGLPDLPLRREVSEVEGQVVSVLEKVSPMNLLDNVGKSLRGVGLPTLPGMNNLKMPPITGELSLGRTGDPKGDYKTIEGKGTPSAGKVYRSIE